MNRRKESVKCLNLILVIALLFCLCGCKTEVEDKDYSLEYNSKTYDGQYTGTMEDGNPSEHGKFVCGEEGDKKYLIYDGFWEQGKMKGTGQLITNNYVYDLSQMNPKEDSKIELTGTYKGDVVNGIADGEGVYFVSGNDDEGNLLYTGEWKAGLWSGEGKLELTKDGPVIEGRFENGQFKSTVADLIKIYGTFKNDCPYTISEEAYAYIESNEAAFSKHEKKQLTNI